MLLEYLRLKGEKTFRIQSDGFKCVNNNLFVLNINNQESDHLGRHNMKAELWTLNL